MSAVTPDPAATEPTPDPVALLQERAGRVRTDMGGAAKVERIHERGRRTVREHIEGFCDLAAPSRRSARSPARPTRRPADTPGDGKIGGHATFGGGRPVTVFGDDVTVRRGSSSLVGSRKIERLDRQALTAGNPIVHFGQTGGARIPDTLGTEGFVEVTPKRSHSLRRRRVPLCTIIVGDSFGGSSFLSAYSDFVVQVRGTCLAVTSPRVFEVATGEVISFEDLGGVDVHARITGQIDQFADDRRRGLRAGPALPRLPAAQRLDAARAGGRWRRSAWSPTPSSTGWCPRAAGGATTCARCSRRLVDGGEFLELRPLMGRSLISCLARIDGWPVGIVASQPLQQAGVLGPDACDKATKLIVLCDAFDLPLVFLQDVPGFLVGRQVEHAKILHKAILFQQALHLAEVPKLTVVLRKAFGLAYFSLAGNDQGADLVCAWPGAEIGFMDPDVGASVLYGTPLQHLDRRSDWPSCAAGRRPARRHRPLRRRRGDEDRRDHRPRRHPPCWPATWAASPGDRSSPVPSGRCATGPRGGAASSTSAAPTTAAGTADHGGHGDDRRRRAAHVDGRLGGAVDPAAGRRGQADQGQQVGQVRRRQDHSPGRRATRSTSPSAPRAGPTPRA